MSFQTIAAIISTLATVEECDNVILQIDNELSELAYQSMLNERRNERAVDSSGKLEADLSAAQSVKSAYETTISSLPVEDPTRDIFEDELVRVNYRIFTFEKRLERLGKGALLQYTINNDTLQSKISDFQNAKTDVETHKATL